MKEIRAGRTCVLYDRFYWEGEEIYYSFGDKFVPTVIKGYYIYGMDYYIESCQKHEISLKKYKFNLYSMVSSMSMLDGIAVFKSMGFDKNGI